MKTESEFTQVTLTFDPSKWVSCDVYSRGFAALPDGPGIYAIYGLSLDKRLMPTAPKMLCYIGISQNLRRRLEGQHPALKQVKRSFEHSYRHFQTCPFDIAADLERFLIQKYSPPLNITHRTSA